MTLQEKRKASLHMKKFMENKDSKFSIYNLWENDTINWLVFRQEMFRYFGATDGDSRPSLVQMNYVKAWAKRFNNKRKKQKYD